VPLLVLSSTSIYPIKLKSLLVKLLKVLLPSFVPFVVFSYAVKNYAHLDSSNGATVLESLIYYYRYIWPLLYVAAILMQYLVIVPLWHKALEGTRVRKLLLLVTLILVCTGIATGISYAIWDEAAGAAWLQNAIFTITVLELAFWFINLLVLTIISAFKGKTLITE
jgi:hypothetical protein